MLFSPIGSNNARCDLVSQVSTTFHQKLVARGQLVEQSGTLRTENRHLSIHSEFGPGGQAKRTNQDSAFLWRPTSKGRLGWAMAIADGVSQSFGAQYGSRLACLAALGSLCSWHNGVGTLDPIKACVLVFDCIGKKIEASPEKYCPIECFPNTWQRAVRDGRYFQTTITVAWETSTRLYVAAIGDGGCVLEFGDSSKPLVLIPSAEESVDALGPKNGTRLAKLILAFPESQCRRLAVFTDGASPVVADCPDIFGKACGCRTNDEASNPAELATQGLLCEAQGKVTDNITVGISLRREKEGWK